MNIISFSLWGSNPKYTIGAIYNSILAKEIYQGWICRFYIDNTVDPDIINILKKMDNVEIVLITDKTNNNNNMIWRFQAFIDPKVEVCLIRDTDSRLNIRELTCVNEFIHSNKKFHTIKDHPCHRYSKANIMGGLCGVKKGLFDKEQFINVYNQYTKEYKYQSDQDMLFDIIKLFDNDLIMSHDEINDKLPDEPNKVKNSISLKIPIPRFQYQFMGSPYDENNNQEEESKIKFT